MFLYLRREQRIFGRIRTQWTSINVARQREKEEVKREVDASYNIGTHHENIWTPYRAMTISYTPSSINILVNISNTFILLTAVFLCFRMGFNLVTTGWVSEIGLCGNQSKWLKLKSWSIRWTSRDSFQSQENPAIAFTRVRKMRN